MVFLGMGSRALSRVLVLSITLILFSGILSVSFTSAATISQFDDFDVWVAQLTNPNSLRTINFEGLGLGIQANPLVIDGIVTVTDPNDPNGILIEIDPDTGNQIMVLNKDATIDFPAGTGGAGLTDSFKHDQGTGITATDGDGDTDKARGFKSPGTQTFVGFDSSAGIVKFLIGKGSAPAIGINFLHFEFNLPPDAVDDPNEDVL